MAGPMAQIGAGWPIISHETDRANDSFLLKHRQVASIQPKEYQLLAAPNLVARTSNTNVASKYIQDIAVRIAAYFASRLPCHNTASQFSSGERGTIIVSIPAPISVRNWHIRAPAMMYLPAITTFLILLNVVGAQLKEQQPSATASVCSCAPTNFIFRLDFTRSCDDNTVPIGKTHGIDRSFCRTDNVDGVGGGDAEAVTVVKLTSVLILELDSDLRVIKQHFRDGLDLEDGETLEYASIAADDGIADDTTVAAIQMALTGISKEGTEIQSQFILTYTNNCGTDVFRVGDAISWLEVVSSAKMNVNAVIF